VRQGSAKSDKSLSANQHVGALLDSLIGIFINHLGTFRSLVFNEESPDLGDLTEIQRKTPVVDRASLYLEIQWALRQRMKPPSLSCKSSQGFQRKAVLHSTYSRLWAESFGCEEIMRWGQACEAERVRLTMPIFLTWALDDATAV
jgi:hypothetical protein